MRSLRIYVIGAIAGAHSYRHIQDLVLFLGERGFEFVYHPQ